MHFQELPPDVLSLAMPPKEPHNMTCKYNRLLFSFICLFFTICSYSSGNELQPIDLNKELESAMTTLSNDQDAAVMKINQVVEIACKENYPISQRSLEQLIKKISVMSYEKSRDPAVLINAQSGAIQLAIGQLFQQSKHNNAISEELVELVIANFKVWLTVWKPNYKPHQVLGKNESGFDFGNKPSIEADYNSDAIILRENDIQLMLNSAVRNQVNALDQLFKQRNIESDSPKLKEYRVYISGVILKL